MPRATYPTAAELQTALTSAGLFSPGWNLNLANAVASAAASWERDTDWGPFLAGASESARRFTVSGASTLFLGGGLVAPPSLVTCNGIELERDFSYFLEPANSRPFTRLKFASRRTSTYQGVVIIGRWGYCEQLPDDVWNAVLVHAALNLGGEIQRRFLDDKTAAANAAGLIKAKESGPVRVEFQTIDGTKTLDLKATFEAWAGIYDDALSGLVMMTP